MSIIAIDPGISTGVAIHTSDGEYITLVVNDPKKLWDLLITNEPDVVCVENFASGGIISKDGQATIRLVGAIEMACYIKQYRLVVQFPQERYSQMENARAMIKQTGRRIVSHEVDALAHLLLLEHRIETSILDKITQGRRNTYA